MRQKEIVVGAKEEKGEKKGDGVEVAAINKTGMQNAVVVIIVIIMTLAVYAASYDT